MRGMFFRGMTLSCCVGMSAALMASQSNAQFLNETVQIAHVYPNTTALFTGLGLPQNFIVGGGIELSDYASAISFDISNSSISIVLAPGVNASIGDGSPNSFSGYSFGDVLGNIPAIVSASINGSTSLPGFDSSRLTFSENLVAVNIEGLSTGVSSRTVAIDVVFAPVPELSSTALLIGGLLTVGVVSRRRQYADRAHVLLAY